MSIQKLGNLRLSHRMNLASHQSKKSTFIDISEWLDLLVISILSISIIAIVLLTLDLFSPKTTVFTGMVIAIPWYYVASCRNGGLADIRGVSFFVLASIIFFALIFRVHPFPWINGGQDQGVYVSMSSYYQHGGKIFIEDDVLPTLSDENLKATYLKNRSKYQPHAYQPGIYYGGKKDYVFQFYHLHPLWMAIFADVLGDAARSYSVVFFGIISIVFLGLLTFELCESKCAAISVALLLAINPLHTFFSKWPVTEIVALAFSSMGFYYLARSYRLSAQLSARRWALSISCISISLLFFVRISGFLYIPFYAIVFMAGAWQLKKQKDKFGVDLMIFSLAVVLLYLVSVAYGLIYSPNYSQHIYRLTFGRVFNGNWIAVMTIGFSCMVVILLLWYWCISSSYFSSKIKIMLSPRILIYFILLIGVLATALSVFKVYQLGFTDVYSNNKWLGTRWKLSGSGMQAVWRSSVLNWLIYSSPALFFCGSLALLWRKFNFKVVLLSVVVCIPLLLVITNHIVLPYQYYYARYLLSESVPYAIVLFVVAMFYGNSKNWKRLGVASVILTIPLFAFFTVKQFGAEEGVRPRKVLEQIAAEVDKEDLLLIEPKGWSIPRHGVTTPLKMFFGLKTFYLPLKELDNSSKMLLSSFKRVWVLSPQYISNDKIVLEKKLLHYDKVMERSGHIPLKIVDNFWHQELFLYLMKK